MTETNGLETVQDANQNGHVAGLAAAAEERPMKVTELLKQMREKIAVLDPESKVSKLTVSTAFG